MYIFYYSWFTRFCQFLLYSKVTQLYVYMCVCVCVVCVYTPHTYMYTHIYVYTHIYSSSFVISFFNHWILYQALFHISTYNSLPHFNGYKAFHCENNSLISFHRSMKCGMWIAMWFVFLYIHPPFLVWEQGVSQVFF